ncbi:MAG: DUF756 domain-containing protein [Verrucomicrobia bacterium]|nr:DUF756 domain-containing protein [Verrucomicrobiota bacterium]
MGNGAATGHAVLTLDSTQEVTATLTDLGYGEGETTLSLVPGKSSVHVLDLSRSHQWYDVRIAVPGFPHFSQRFSGHIETGRESTSDPLLA